ncbi:Uncharacterised protein [Streptobacillus moniliformis]|nr:Uncharacterised protein [Streptobacillus moniliformis]
MKIVEKDNIIINSNKINKENYRKYDIIFKFGYRNIRKH